MSKKKLDALVKALQGIDILISFDTTGSMYPCLTQVRRYIEWLIKRLFGDVPGLRIGIIAHGDYCDARGPYVTKTMNFSTDQEALCRFVKNVEPTDGGDRPECYELVLNQARKFDWQSGNEKVLVMIGDDVPHEKSYPMNTGRIDWRNELGLLLEAGIHVYGVHAMPGIRQHSKWFYDEIAKKTGGYYLTLDQFSAINDIILAIIYKQAGISQLQSFQNEVQASHRMSRNMASVFQTLTGQQVKVATRTGLVPVPAGKFQVIEVDADQPIKQFVLAQGLTFKTGRGFYQFTKPEMIQEQKEVVLMDKKTGDMFSGDEARSIIGLPIGMRGKVKPTSMEEYDVFVQSTSYNRKLIGGSLFLYEVE